MSLVKATLGFIAAAMLAACTSKTVSFREEVDLPSGSRIVIEKSITYERYCESFNCGWGDPRHVLRLPYGSASGEAVWDERLLPIYAELRSAKEGAAREEWIVVATPRSCEDYRATDRPVPPYFEFVHMSGSNWKRVPLEARLLNREANLAVNINPGYPPRGTLSIEEKRTLARTASPMHLNIRANAAKIC